MHYNQKVLPVVTMNSRIKQMEGAHASQEESGLVKDPTTYERRMIGGTIPSNDEADQYIKMKAAGSDPDGNFS